LDERYLIALYRIFEAMQWHLLKLYSRFVATCVSSLAASSDGTRCAADF
jgi:hypothetical protein